MDDVRPPIPADIRRKVLVEAGHRCAIPTCRHIEVDVHHIIPWAQCNTHEYDNLIALCPNCHRRADRGEIDRKSLRLYKLNLRFVHDKYSQLEIDILFELNQLPPTQALPWQGYNMILLKRILDSGFITIHETRATISAGKTKMNPDYITISPKGKQFLVDLAIKES